MARQTLGNVQIKSNDVNEINVIRFCFIYIVANSHFYRLIKPISS